MIQNAKNKVLWTYSWWIDLILHIMIEINVFLHLAFLLGHEGSFKSRKNTFLNDPKCQKQGFMDLRLVDCLDIAYYDGNKRFLIYGSLAGS